MLLLSGLVSSGGQSLGKFGRQHGDHHALLPKGQGTLEAHVQGWRMINEQVDPAWLEPKWKGPRAVCVSQGSTGTHGFFDAVTKLGLPAAHYFEEHRAADSQIGHVPHKNGKTYRKTGPSFFSAHDALLDLCPPWGDARRPQALAAR